MPISPLQFVHTQRISAKMLVCLAVIRHYCGHHLRLVRSENIETPAVKLSDSIAASESGSNVPSRHPAHLGGNPHCNVNEGRSPGNQFRNRREISHYLGAGQYYLHINLR